jgi:hypothetical protein
MNTRPGPPHDPYSTLSGVKFLDERLGQLEQSVARVSRAHRANPNPNDVQLASLQLIPAASSIAQSARHLIQGGYLLSAAILLRPLLERVATLAYLEQHPDAVAMWNAGWVHGERPSLRMRLGCVIPGAPDTLLSGFMQDVSTHNSLIHGDPTAANVSLMQIGGRLAYAPDRDYATPQRAHDIAYSAALDVVFLILIIDRIFPSREDDPSGGEGNGGYASGHAGDV